MFNFKLHFINDIGPERKEAFLNTVKDNTQFSLSYVSLLVASTIICTLGLLINSPATIIGGMIIAPLMWPLVKISTGISLARKSYILEAIYLLLGSLALILITASFITLISPLKGLNNEILSRSQPTLLDLFIALAAGTIAALALIHKRISSSLAGVAIATSLLPPLCVTGIGFALTNFSITSGSFLLFAANAVSIIFISIFVFRFAGITNHIHEEFRNESILFVAIMLAITALPLFIFLREYSFKAEVFQKTDQVLEETFKEISPSIIIQNVSTNVSNQKENILISADILVPEDITLSVEQKDQIIAHLEDSLEKKVQLNLLVQQTIALESQNDQQTELKRKKIREEFISQVGGLNKDIAIDGVTINLTSSGWEIISVMRANPTIQFTEVQREEIEKKLALLTDRPVSLSLEIIPRISLAGETNTVHAQMEEDIMAFLNDIDEDIEIRSLNIAGKEQDRQIAIEIITPQNVTVTVTQLTRLKNILEEEYDMAIEFTVNNIKKQMYSL